MLTFVRLLSSVFAGIVLLVPLGAIYGATNLPVYHSQGTGNVHCCSSQVSFEEAKFSPCAEGREVTPNSASEVTPLKGVASI
jgi:hypothetical protein